jgi:hypothetical protein
MAPLREELAVAIVLDAERLVGARDGDDVEAERERLVADDAIEIGIGDEWRGRSGHVAPRGLAASILILAAGTGFL